MQLLWIAQLNAHQRPKYPHLFFERPHRNPPLHTADETNRIRINKQIVPLLCSVILWEWSVCCFITDCTRSLQFDQWVQNISKLCDLFLIASFASTTLQTHSLHNSSRVLTATPLRNAQTFVEMPIEFGPFALLSVVADVRLCLTFAHTTLCHLNLWELSCIHQIHELRAWKH